MLKTNDLYVHAFVDGKQKVAQIVKQRGNMFDVILVASRKFLTIHRNALSTIEDKPTRKKLKLDVRYALVDNGAGRPMTTVPNNAL